MHTTAIYDPISLLGLNLRQNKYLYGTQIIVPGLGFSVCKLCVCEPTHDNGEFLSSGNLLKKEKNIYCSTIILNNNNQLGKIVYDRGKYNVKFFIYIYMFKY